VAVVDVHGQIRMGLGQLGKELLLERRVDGVPEGGTAGLDVGDIANVYLARRAGREGALDIRAQARAEGAETVDCSRDTVEADAFQTDFAYQLGRP
jgi:hypothetical protein